MKTEILIKILGGILTGALTSYIAYKRDRNPTLWFFVGLLFGWIGLLVIFFLPSQEDIAKYRQKIVDNERARQKRNKEQKEAQITLEIKIPAFADKEWYYLDKSFTQQGPVSFLLIQGSYDKREIVGETYVWYTGMAEWQKLASLPEVVAYLERK